VALSAAICSSRTRSRAVVDLVDVLAQTADVDNVLWPRDELAVGFHRRLVVIHASANSNGRYSMLADLLVSHGNT